VEAKLARLKELINQREAIDSELGQILGIEKKERKAQVCSKCGQEGHSARTCIAGSADAN
jgi:hypothetical protein